MDRVVGFIRKMLVLSFHPSLFAAYNPKKEFGHPSLIPYKID